MLVVEFGEIQAGFVEKINVFLANAKTFSHAHPSFDF